METQNELITLFQNETLRVECYEKAINESKGVHVHVKAINPSDGKEYERYAGWLSRTLALHGGARTQGYAYDEACAAIEENKDAIFNALVSAGRKFMVGGNAGAGVTDKIAHPKGEVQRQKVRVMMQKNAPHGTNHL